MNTASIVTAGQLRIVLAGAAAEFATALVQPLERSTKADGTVVTGVDTALNAWLRTALTTMLADAAWLSEESVDDSARFSAAATWVVDPLDGTKELARGCPEYAISVALVSDGVAVAGAVMNPASGLGAAAGTDGSWEAWPADYLARAHARPTMTSVSRSETEDGLIDPYVDIFAPVEPIGSVANKLLRVACGLERMTVSVQPKSEWDICGGVALLQARGLVLVRLDRQPLRFNQVSTRIPGGFVAGAPAEVTACIDQMRARMPASTLTATAPR